MHTALPLVTAIVTGFMQMFLAIYAWGFYAAHPVVVKGILSHFEKPVEPVLMFAHDLAVNMLLWVPFIIILLMLRPKRPWLYVAAAVVPTVLLMNANMGWETLVWAWPHLLREVAQSVISPVLVTLILGRIGGYWTTPNQRMQFAPTARRTGLRPAADAGR